MPFLGLAQLPRCGHCKGAGDLVIVLSHHQRTPSRPDSLLDVEVPSTPEYTPASL